MVHAPFAGTSLLVATDPRRPVTRAVKPRSRAGTALSRGLLFHTLRVTGS